MAVYLEVPRGIDERRRRSGDGARENARKIAERRDLFEGRPGGSEFPREMEDDGGAAVERGNQVFEGGLVGEDEQSSRFAGLREGLDELGGEFGSVVDCG